MAFQVGIIACGAGGLTIALDHHARLGELAKIYAPPEHLGWSEKVRQQADIEVYMALEGRFKVDIEGDLEGLVKHCKWIFVTSDTGGHAEILQSLEPYKVLLKDTILIWITGNGTGLVAHEKLRPLNTIETSRLQYTCRVDNMPEGELKVRLNGYKKRVVFASYHPLAGELPGDFNKILGMPGERSPGFLDILFVGNHGYVHMPTMLHGQHFIESGLKLFFYRDLMTPTVCKEMIAAWVQLCNLARAYKLTKPEHPTEVFNKDYGTSYPLTLEGLIRFVKECEELNRKPGLPPNMKARQLTQEARFICPLWSSLAKAAHVDLSIVDGWIDQACKITGENYWETGRSLAYYGLREDASIEAILTRFRINI